jgi:hypothetical protein
MNDKQKVGLPEPVHLDMGVCGYTAKHMHAHAEQYARAMVADHAAALAEKDAELRDMTRWRNEADVFVDYWTSRAKSAEAQRDALMQGLNVIAAMSWDESGAASAAQSLKAISQATLVRAAIQSQENTDER